ncbi:MAG: MBL fold metallo-hydrolase [Microgenomates group bacterium]
MDITYLGKEIFKIKAKNGAVQAGEDKLTIFHKSGGEDFVISQPGEYEVEGISVFGYKAETSNVYVVQFDDIRVAYLGNLEKILTEKTIAELENIDAVILSVETLPIKDMVEMVAKLEPYYVLPYGEQTAKFVAAYEHGSRSVKSLNLSKVSLSEDLTEVIVFE